MRPHNIYHLQTSTAPRPEAAPAGVATFPRPARNVSAADGVEVEYWAPAASRRNAVLFRTARAAASRRGGPQSVPPQSAPAIYRHYLTTAASLGVSAPAVFESQPAHIANPKHYIYTTDMNRRIGSLHSAPIGISVGNGGLFVFLHPASVSFFGQHDDAAARKAAAGTHHHITHKQGRKGSARKLPSRFPSETEPEFGFFSPAAVSFFKRNEYMKERPLQRRGENNVK